MAGANNALSVKRKGQIIIEILTDLYSYKLQLNL